MAEVLDGDYETVEDAAKAALKQAATSFTKREFLSVAVKSEQGTPYLFGAYFYESDAVKASKPWREAGFECIPVRVHDNIYIEARHQGIPVPGDCECGHEPTIHTFGDGKGRGYCTACGALSCKKFKAKDWPEPAPILYDY